MDFRKFGNDYILRIDRGEEILAVIADLCRSQNIKLASVIGLGACGEVTLGVFNREKFAYEKTEYQGDYELSSCNGSVSTMDGKPYLHIHATIGNPTKNVCYGGHLSRAVVSLTGEFVIHTIDGEVDRAYSDEVGLNLFKFL